MPLRGPTLGIFISSICSLFPLPHAPVSTFRCCKRWNPLHPLGLNLNATCFHPVVSDPVCKYKPHPCLCAVFCTFFQCILLDRRCTHPPWSFHEKESSLRAERHLCGPPPCVTTSTKGVERGNMGDISFWIFKFHPLVHIFSPWSSP